MDVERKIVDQIKDTYKELERFMDLSEAHLKELVDRYYSKEIDARQATSDIVRQSAKIFYLIGVKMKVERSQSSSSSVLSFDALEVSDKWQPSQISESFLESHLTSLDQC